MHIPWQRTRPEELGQRAQQTGCLCLCFKYLIYTCAGRHECHVYLDHQAGCFSCRCQHLKNARTRKKLPAFGTALFDPTEQWIPQCTREKSFETGSYDPLAKYLQCLRQKYFPASLLSELEPRYSHGVDSKNKRTAVSYSN